VKTSLRLDVLPESQVKVFESLAEQDFVADFYLAGGTCLALHIGHRQSIDFDFFIPEAEGNLFTRNIQLEQRTKSKEQRQQQDCNTTHPHSSAKICQTAKGS